MTRRNNRKPQPQRGPKQAATAAQTVANGADDPAIVDGANGAATLASPVRATAVAEPQLAPTVEAAQGAQSFVATRLGGRRLDLALALGFAAIALVLYFWRIEAPWNGNKAYIYDEVYHVYTAQQWVKGNTDPWLWTTRVPDEGFAYEWTHPPLGKEIIAVSILLFGDNTFGWRAASAVFGAIGIALIYWLGLVLTRRRVAACLAAILTLADGLYFVESRAGLLDIFGAIFMVGAFLAFYAYLKAPADKVRWPLLGLGLGLGLAIATKWNAGYAAAIIGVVVMVRTGYLLFKSFGGDEEGRAAYRAGFRQHLLWVPLFMAVLPAAIYMLTYGPFFGAGFSFQQFRDLQYQMYYYHSHLKDTHAYGSKWWQWPLTQRPVWYGVQYFSEGIVGYTYANGNPLLYWSFFAALPYALVLWWQRERYKELLVLAIGFFGQWLPWALVPRTAYVYHFLPAAIFGALAVAVTLNDLWELGDRQITAQRPPLWRYLAIGYIVAIVAAFVFFYPIYTNWPLNKAEFDARIWISTWR